MSKLNAPFNTCLKYRSEPWRWLDTLAGVQLSLRWKGYGVTWPQWMFSGYRGHDGIDAEPLLMGQDLNLSQLGNNRHGIHGRTITPLNGFASKWENISNAGRVFDQYNGYYIFLFCNAYLRCNYRQQLQLSAYKLQDFKQGILRRKFVFIEGMNPEFWI